MRANKTLKYRKALSFLIYNKGYLESSNLTIDKSFYPYVLGTRDNSIYYDLPRNLMGMKNTLEIIQNILVDQGHIFIVGGTIELSSTLLCFYNVSKCNITIMPWKFSCISKNKNFDLLFLHEINPSSQLEVYNKMLPYVGVNTFNTKDLSYIFNLNFKNTALQNWYLYTLVFSFRKGIYSCIKKKKK